MNQAIEQDPEHVIWNLERIQEIDHNPYLGQWQYGIVFKAPPQLLMRAMAEVFGELNTVILSLRPVLSDKPL